MTGMHMKKKKAAPHYEYRFRDPDTEGGGDTINTKFNKTFKENVFRTNIRPEIRELKLYFYPSAGG